MTEIEKMEEKTKKTSTAKKAVIKKKKYVVELVGSTYFVFKNKNGGLSWMPIPRGKELKVGDEVEI